MSILMMIDHKYVVLFTNTPYHPIPSNYMITKVKGFLTPLEGPADKLKEMYQTVYVVLDQIDLIVRELKEITAKSDHKEEPSHSWGGEDTKGVEQVICMHAIIDTYTFSYTCLPTCLHTCLHSCLQICLHHTCLHPLTPLSYTLTLAHPHYRLILWTWYQPMLVPMVYMK